MGLVVSIKARCLFNPTSVVNQRTLWLMLRDHFLSCETPFGMEHEDYNIPFGPSPNIEQRSSWTKAGNTLHAYDKVDRSLHNHELALIAISLIPSCPRFKC